MPKPSQDKPTVGRIVWVWMIDEDMEANGFVAENQNQPFAGQVIFFNERSDLATVEAVDHEGNRNVIGDVTIFDPEEDDGHDHESGESFVTWMPYQKKQHDKHRVENDAAEALNEEKVGTRVRDAVTGRDLGSAE